jgi:hypothetical protein
MVTEEIPPTSTRSLLEFVLFSFKHKGIENNGFPTGNIKQIRTGTPIGGVN